MTDELLSCPFCGGQASKRLFYGGKYGIYCDECSARVGGLYDTEAEAISAWNTRAPMSYEDLRILLDEFGVSERTCRIEHVKKGAMYDVWRCSACGYEYAESVSEESIAQKYCPNCGAKVVSE